MKQSARVARAGGIVASLLAAAAVPSLVTTEGDGPVNAQAPASARVAGATRVALPLRFERNLGQAGQGAAFVARGRRMSVLLEDGGATFVLAPPAGGAPERVRIGVAGARTGCSVVGEEPTGAKSHYLLGAAPDAWHTDVPLFARVRYAQILPGIDLVFHGSDRDAEYDFVVAPGASPDAIQLDLAADGDVTITPGGELAITTSRGTLMQRAPVAYQELEGRRVAVGARYRRTESGRIAFAMDEFDRRSPLVIDPVVAYATYLGGSANDEIDAVAVDSHDDVYVVGQTASVNFPVQGGEQTKSGGGALDVFVAKIDGHSHALVYSTYLGGSGSDGALAVAALPDGSIAVAGKTDSQDFPTTAGAPQRTLGGHTDAFVVRLDASGSSLSFGSYLGGELDDSASAIASDGSGALFAVGTTDSVAFPVAHALYPTLNGGANKSSAIHYEDAFLTKLEAGGAVAFSTYLGGALHESGRGVAVSPSGRIGVTGTSGSSDFPTHNPLQSTMRATASFNAFVTELAADGQSLLYSTFLGGSGGAYGDTPAAIAFDSAERAFVAGTTTSSDFPTANASQSKYGGDQDAFISRLEANGSALGYSTYLGGAFTEQLYGLGITADGRVFVAGQTQSSDYPTLNAIQGSLVGGYDVFAAAYDPGGAMQWSTFGPVGNGSIAHGIAPDHAGNAYVVGVISHDGLATAGALQEHPAGGTDGFILEIGSAGPVNDAGGPDASEAGPVTEEAGADGASDARADGPADADDGGHAEDASDASDAGGIDSSLGDASVSDAALEDAEAPHDGAVDAIADGSVKDTGAGGGADAELPVDAANGPGPGSSDTDSGCGCHVGPATGGTPGFGFGVVGLVLGLAYRRRRRSEV